MKAKDMFKELGYHCVYKNYEYYIDYSKSFDPIEEDGIMIQFQLVEKQYRIYSYGIIRDEIIAIDMQLNKAIQKQIEELGWLD